MTTLVPHHPLGHRADAGPLHLEFCRAEIGGGYLWLQYAVRPVPDAVRAHGPVRDVVCGDALDPDGRHLAHCRASYRIGLDYREVAGVVAVGPGFGTCCGPVRLAFAPLAVTPGFTDALCEAEIVVEGATVRHVGARMHTLG